MIKKLFVLASACVISLAIFGCSSGSSSTTQSNDQQKGSVEQTQQSNGTDDASSSSDSSSSSLFSTDEWPVNTTTEGVPVPSFSVGYDSLSTSEGSVSASWKNVPEGEAEQYIESIKQAGFVYEASETKSSTSYSYNAWNNEDILKSQFVNISYLNDGAFSISISDNRM